MSEARASEYNGAQATRSVATALPEKGSHWSITINNPTEDDLRQWASLKDLPWVLEVSGQLEQGENETPHIQGYVKSSRIRWGKLKKALPRAHLEVARNPVALARYVVKEDTRVSAIPTVKVATQADVQRVIHALTCSHLRLIPLETSADQLAQAIAAEEQRLWGLHGYRGQIQYFAKQMFREAIETLVVQGFYGVEYVCSNNQVRSAFIGYFPSIVIREHNAYRFRHSQTPSNHQASSNSQDDENTSHPDESTQSAGQ